MNTSRTQLLTLFVTAATALGGNSLDRWQMIQPKPTPQPIRVIAYGDGRWVGGGISSSNGIDWEAGSLSHDFSRGPFGYANGLWVSGGIRLIRPNCNDGVQFCDGLFTSTNGLDWTHHLEATELFCDLGADALFTDIAFGNGRWIVMGRSYGRYLTSTNGVNWTPEGLGRLLGSQSTTRAVAYGNGMWIITSPAYPNNALFTSSDGLNWAGPIVGPAYFNDLTYANGQWVAVGEHRIWTSTNGLNWTARYQGILNQDKLSSVRYADGRWQCVGNRSASSYTGLVLTSTDAVNWTLLRQDTARIYLDSAYGSNQWVIVGEDTADQNNYTGALLTSSNGTTWTDRTVRSAFSTAKLRFDAGRWVAVGGNTGQVVIATSTNGISWSTVTPTPVLKGTDCRTVAYGDSQWAALAVRYTYTPQFKEEPVTLTSSNGTSWLIRTGGVFNATALDFGQGKWVACHQSNVYTAFSTNFNWTPTLLPSSFRAGTFSDLHFANGLWVMVGIIYAGSSPSPLIITSPDGSSWTQRSLSVTNGQIFAIAHAQGQWVAVGQENITIAECGPNLTASALVLTSPDGVNWIQRDTGLPRGPNPFSRSSLSGIAWTGDEWVAAGLYSVIGERALVLTSPDAITWQMHPSVIGAGLGFAAYGNGRVVIGGGTMLLVSAPLTPAAPVLGLDSIGNQLLLRLTGSIGATYDIQQTPQLSTPSWAFQQSVTLSNASQQILALPATNSSTFWRARSL